jgi:O-antigen ligase
MLWAAYIALHVLLLKGTYNSRHPYLLINVLLYFSLSILLTQPGFPIRWLYRVIAVLALLESMVCIAQYLGFIESFNNYFRVTGTLVNPNLTAMFLAMATGPTLSSTLALPNREEKRKAYNFWITFLIMGFILVALVMLKCRTAYIGATVLAMVMLSYRYGFLRHIINKQIRIIAIALLIVILGLTIPFISSIYHSKEASTEGRKTVWKITLQMIADRPVTGYGYGLFEPNYNLYQAKYFESGKATQQEIENSAYVKMAYNEPLENTVEGGIIGLLFFLGVLVSLVVTYFKQSVNETICQSANVPMKMQNKYFQDQAVAFAGVCAFTVMSLVNFTIQAIPVMGLFMMYAALISAPSQFQKKEKKNRPVASITLGIFLVVIALYFGITRAGTGMAQLKLKNTVSLRKQDNTGKTLAVMKSLEPQLATSEGYQQQYGKALMANEQYTQALVQFGEAARYTSLPDLYMNISRCYEKLGDTMKAENNYRLAMNIQPSRFAPRYALMQLYLRTGNMGKAEDMAKGIIQLKPKVPSKEVEFYKREALKLVQKFEGSKVWCLKPASV